MKLATAALAVSLVGCAADNDGEGGAYLDGLRPAKPSIEDFNRGPGAGINPAIEFILNGGLSLDVKDGGFRTPDGGDVSSEKIDVPFPVEGLCEHCNDRIVLRDQRNPGELFLLDDHGHFFCRLWVDPQTGRLVSTDCR